MTIVPYVIIVGFALISYLLRKLTLVAAVTAVIVALYIFVGAGYTGLEMLGAFFIIGVAATSWRKQDKEILKPAADRGNRRDAWQVLANGGVAAVCGLLAALPAFTSCHQTLCLMMAGSLAAAAADTLSSELGMVYGHRFYNVISFKADQKGLDGVISLEGTLIGIVGAAIIALIFCRGFSNGFWLIIAAGAVGNYIDSLLGATVERKGLLNNNMVNLANTLAGALVALVLFLL